MVDTLRIKRTVSRVAGADYSPGYVAPETTGDQQVPHADSTSGTIDVDHGATDTRYAKRARRNARQQSPNDWGWRHQDRAEMGAYRETTVPMTQSDGAQIMLSPDVCQVYQIDAAGSVTFAFDTVSDGYDPPDPNAEAASFTESLVIWIRRQSGGVINWPTSINWDSSIATDAFAAPTSVRIDCYLLVNVPLFGWLGFVTAQGFGTQGTNAGTTAS